MLKQILAPAALLVLSLTACSEAPESSESELDYYPVLGDLEPGRVSYCNDGDTCAVTLASGKKLKIRLGGIDAPETSSGGQPFGKEAADFINSLIKGQNVQVRQIGPDPYGRVIGELYTSSFTLVSLKMVGEGYAEAYRGASKGLDKKTYFKHEQKARDQKLRIWGLENYEPPYQFRKRTKAGN